MFREKSQLALMLERYVIYKLNLYAQGEITAGINVRKVCYL
jgi:hypothetical protein